jgi:hypothetical protein
MGWESVILVAATRLSFCSPPSSWLTAQAPQSKNFVLECSHGVALASDMCCASPTTQWCPWSLFQALLVIHPAPNTPQLSGYSADATHARAGSGSTLVTPWHPVRIEGSWTFPCRIVDPRPVHMTCVYNVILDSGHVRPPPFNPPASPISRRFPADSSPITPANSPCVPVSDPTLVHRSFPSTISSSSRSVTVSTMTLSSPTLSSARRLSSARWQRDTRSAALSLFPTDSEGAVICNAAAAAAPCPPVRQESSHWSRVWLCRRRRLHLRRSRPAAAPRRTGVLLIGARRSNETESTPQLVFARGFRRRVLHSLRSPAGTARVSFFTKSAALICDCMCFTVRAIKITRRCERSVLLLQRTNARSREGHQG